MFRSNQQRQNARTRRGWLSVAVALAIAMTMLLALTIVAYAQHNSATLNRWTSNGPDGGWVLSLAIDRTNPATMYAGTPGGVFKSADGGESWSSSLTNVSAQIVAIAPSTPTTIYAAGSNGVHKSVDGGTSWNGINHGLENQNGPINILALAIDPSNSNTVFAAGPDITDPSVTYKAIYETIDGGASWSITKYSIRSFAIHHALAVDPINTNTIYAGGSVGWGTVWKSTDGGYFWTIVNLGPDSRSTVLALTIDPTNTNVLYAGTAGQGVFKSTDGGATWAEFNDGLPFYSTDENGKRYFYSVSSIVIDPIDPTVIYAGTAGVFKSTKGGSWTTLTGGLTNPYINALAISSNNPNIICAGTYNGIFKTFNGGASWKVYNRGLRGAHINSLAVNPGNADVYAGTYDGTTFKSINNGGSWSPTNFYPLAFDPHNPNTIYARLEGSDGLFESSNAGATWSSVTVGPPNTYTSLVAIDPNNSNVRYAVTDVLYKSTDGGGSWTAVGNLPYFYTYLLAIDPSNSQTLYATYSADGDTVTVYKSLDGGATWNPSGEKDSITFYWVSTLAIDPKNTATLYAVACAVGTGPCGIYKSTDSGGNWTRAAGQAPHDNDISSLVVDPVQPNVIYIGTYSDGVFKSSDGGASLNPFNDGLTELFINALSIDAAGNFLHAGTLAGAFDLQLAVLPTNQIDEAQFFVRQQYLDFLGREPDPLGADWVKLINNCSPGDTSCDRIHVSEAFFKSPEFQQRGYFAYRFYSVSFGRKPDFAEFMPDLQRVSGFLTDDQLEAAKIAFINNFMARDAFKSRYDPLSNQSYLDTLLSTAGVSLSNRQALIDVLNNGTETRAQVLRQIAESSEVYQKYYNQAFVVMQYFGYLRRDPDILYLDWIDVLDANPSDSRHMIEGFVNSIEYRHRFGP